jgi:hypothetical protein
VNAVPDYRDRSRPYRVVRRDEHAPRVVRREDTPPPEWQEPPGPPEPPEPPTVNLRRGPLAALLAGLPQWQRSVITVVMASGLSLGGVVKFVGVETTRAASERENKITLRIIAIESKLTELKQGIRKDGLSKQAQLDVVKAVEGALARLVPPKGKPKLKPKPAADAPPAEPEGDPAP